MSTFKTRAREIAKQHNPKPPKLCSDCRKERPLVKHHSDYSRPLFITWLCKSCHGKAHGKGLSKTVESVDYAKTESNCPKMVRLDGDTRAALTSIQKKCPWKTSLSVLANYAINHGKGNTLRAFNPKKQ